MISASVVHLRGNRNRRAMGGIRVGIFDQAHEHVSDAAEIRTYRRKSRIDSTFTGRPTRNGRHCSSAAATISSIPWRSSFSSNSPASRPRHLRGVSHELIQAVSFFVNYRKQFAPIGLAADSREQRLVTEALMEVSGVRKSCVIESSSAERKLLAFARRFRFAQPFNGAGAFGGDCNESAQRFERLARKESGPKSRDCREAAHRCAPAQTEICDSRSINGSSRFAAFLISSSSRWASPPPER